MRCASPIEDSVGYFTAGSSNMRLMHNGCSPTIWNGSNLSWWSA